MLLFLWIISLEYIFKTYQTIHSYSYTGSIKINNLLCYENLIFQKSINIKSKHDKRNIIPVEWNIFHRYNGTILWNLIKRSDAI